jgi:hypothetical protein
MGEVERLISKCPDVPTLPIEDLTIVTSASTEGGKPVGRMVTYMEIEL